MDTKLEGYIKIPRSVFESPEWKALTPNGRNVMMALIAGCSWKECEVIVEHKTRKLNPGQWLTSIPTIQKLSGNGISSKHVRGAINTLKRAGWMADEVTEGNHRIITINKWFLYSGNGAVTDDRADDRADGGQTEGRRRAVLEESNNVTSKESLKDLKDKHILSVSKENELCEHDIFNHWNSKKSLIKHRIFKGNLLTQVKSGIKKRITEGFTIPEIKEAIDNYDKVISEPETYYFSYKWSLDLFLKQDNAFRKFVNDAEPLKNFQRKDNSFEKEDDGDPLERVK